MKLFAALAFLFASVVGAPAPCAHAMGPGAANEASPAVEDAHAHHAMDNNASEAGHHDAVVEHQDHGCVDGCDGRDGCEGCTITNAAISTADEFYRHFVFNGALVATFVAGAGKPTILDPPPPRA